MALTYKAGHAAPHVVAKGRGLLAKPLLKKPKAGLFVHESPELVSLLKWTWTKSIPAELYQAVAGSWHFVYYLERRARAATRMWTICWPRQNNRR